MKVHLKVTENSDKFRKSAIHFQKFTTYTFAPPGTSEYLKFWTTEADYCMNGYTAEDGDTIPGYFYFYLNYFPINLVKEIDVKDARGNISKRVLKDRDFPRFYDYDRFFFEAVEEAEKQGKHLSVIKARRKGYSYKVGSMLDRNYYMYRDSKGFALAAEAEFLVKDGILTKAWDGMDFIDQHTAWYKKRQRMDQKMHKRASFLMKDRSGVQLELGYKSEIMGVTLKNDAQKARGKAGKLIIFEEAGKFPNLLQAWQIARPSVEQGSFVFGTMVAFGCVCKGTKVYDKWGKKVNIEDVTVDTGILGYNSYTTVPLEVTSLRTPYKTECYRLTLNSGRTLECSHDHPIVYSRKDLSKRIPGKRATNGTMKYWKWQEASKFKVGDQVGIAESIPVFGNKDMWEPRLVGWLIGDGSYGLDKTPRLSSADREINDYLKENFDIAIEKEHITKDGRQYKETRVRRIVQFLRDLGIYGQTKGLKRLPSNYDLFTKDSLAKMLGGLFDADGYITDPIKRTEINLTAAYKEFLLEVLDLLQKFGINGKISFIKAGNKGKGGTGHYRLSIRDKYSLSNFIENIPFFVEAKAERAERLKKVLTGISSEKSKYISGITFERVVKVENIGEQEVYNLGASEYHTYIANGIITHNTGGTEGADFESLKELFERPSAYNCLEFENIWDENAMGSKCGFFIPQYANLEGHYHNPGDPEDGKPFMDESGNTNVALAKRYILEQRQKVIENASDKRAIDRHIAEQPITPAEATLNISTNIFPKAELQRHLAHIKNNEKIRNFKHVGELYFDPSGKVKWEQSPKEKQKDIIKYKLDRHDDPTGQIVIWEHPMDDPPFGMYIAGIDPYDHDKSGTNSLGSMFIYKRFQTFEKNYETIVAEYTGRPDTANEYYENVRKLLLYYRATALYENEKKGLFFYFEKNHCTHLLADQPGDLIRDIVKDSTVDRKKGIHMNTPIKDWGEGAVKDWLIEEYEPGRKNLTKLYSEALIEELVAYNDTGNFDRVMSFMMVMLYRQQLHHVHVKKKKDLARKNLLFPEPIFTGEIMQKRTFN